jgi:2-hydroxychromene-2-carboxylate isomerase
MTATIDFIFDFGSPNAYLAHRVIGGIAARTGAEVRYVPCLLGGIFKATGNKAPMVQYAGVPAKMAYEMLEMRRFIARHRLTKFRMNPHFPVNTLMLMRGALAAEADGRLADYVEAGMVAMWENAAKMDDPEIYSATFDAAGFDGRDLLARTQDDAVKAALAANTEAAVARGVFGIPSFFVGDDLWFGKDRLGDVEEAVAR